MPNNVSKLLKKALALRKERAALAILLKADECVTAFIESMRGSYPNEACHRSWSVTWIASSNEVLSWRSLPTDTRHN